MAIPSKLQSLTKGVVTAHGTMLINGSTGLVTGSSGVGVRSGSTGAAGVHTIHLGNSGSIATVSNDKYFALVGSVFSVRPLTSGSAFTPPVGRATLQSEAVATSGTVTFTTSHLSASVSAGTITETVGAPTRNIAVDFTLFLKKTSAR